MVIDAKQTENSPKEFAADAGWSVEPKGRTKGWKKQPTAAEWETPDAWDEELGDGAVQLLAAGPLGQPQSILLKDGHTDRHTDRQCTCWVTHDTIPTALQASACSPAMGHRLFPCSLTMGHKTRFKTSAGIPVRFNCSSSPW